LDAAPIARYTGDEAAAQVRRGRTHCHTDTQCQGRNRGGPYTFASSWFHFHFTFCLLSLLGFFGFAGGLFGFHGSSAHQRSPEFPGRSL
jgi:hypothetical protein